MDERINARRKRLEALETLAKLRRPERPYFDPSPWLIPSGLTSETQSCEAKGKGRRFRRWPLNPNQEAND